jgi:hypothetical protein
MSPNHISDAKGKILGKAGKSKPAVAKKPAAPKPATSSAAAKPTPRKEGAAGGVALQDIRILKDLVGRVGPASLRTLIDLLGQ